MLEALKSLLTSTSSRHRPWQISAAVALGVVCGLVPKASLLFYALLAFAYCLPIHLPLTVVTALLLSLAAPAFHGSLGHVGLQSLTHPRWSAFWLRLDAYPLVPWLSLHNSLVHGSALVGTLLLVPSYVLARVVAGAVMGSAESQPVAKLLSAGPAAVVGGSRAEIAAREQPAVSAVDRLGEAISSPSTVQPSELARESTVFQLERILADYDAQAGEEQPELSNASGGDEQPTRADAVIRRAVRMVSLVDDILNSINIEMQSDASVAEGSGSRPLAAPAQPAVHAEAERQAALDMQCESEQSEPGPTAKATGSLPDGDADTHSGAFPSARGWQGRRHFRADDAVGDTPGASQTQSLTAGHPSAAPESLVGPPGALVAGQPTARSSAFGEHRRVNREAREGEALRNLLNHLRELKEKV